MSAGDRLAAECAVGRSRRRATHAIWREAPACSCSVAHGQRIDHLGSHAGGRVIRAAQFPHVCHDPRRPPEQPMGYPPTRRPNADHVARQRQAVLPAVRYCPQSTGRREVIVVDAAQHLTILQAKWGHCHPVPAQPRGHENSSTWLATILPAASHSSNCEQTSRNRAVSIAVTRRKHRPRPGDKVVERSHRGKLLVLQLDRLANPGSWSLSVPQQQIINVSFQTTLGKPPTSPNASLASLDRSQLPGGAEARAVGQLRLHIGRLYLDQDRADLFLHAPGEG